jgi:hypothetical protein
VDELLLNMKYIRALNVRFSRNKPIIYFLRIIVNKELPSTRPMFLSCKHTDHPKQNEQQEGGGGGGGQGGYLIKYRQSLSIASPPQANNSEQC